jgi:Protein of unknown function (DUF1579)
MADDTQAQLPTPDPALRRLDRFVGTWSMEGHLVGSDEITVRGETSFRWLPGGFFLEQKGHLNFMGLELESLELIGYDPDTGTFPSTVFANISATPLPYRWEVDDEKLTISVSYGPLDATFTGTFDEDGDGFRGAGGRTPAPTSRSTCPTTSAGVARGEAINGQESERCRTTTPPRTSS